MKFFFPEHPSSSLHILHPLRINQCSLPLLPFISALTNPWKWPHWVKMIFYFSEQMDTFILKLFRLSWADDSFPKLTFIKKIFSWSLSYLLDPTSLASLIPHHAHPIDFFISHRSILYMLNLVASLHANYSITTLTSKCWDQLFSARVILPPSDTHLETFFIVTTGEMWVLLGFHM